MATDNIYDALRESHERQRSLCRKLVRAKPGTQDRISLFKQFNNINTHRHTGGKIR